jgi:hypothetical protein
MYDIILAAYSALQSIQTSEQPNRRDKRLKTVRTAAIRGMLATFVAIIYIVLTARYVSVRLF